MSKWPDPKATQPVTFVRKEAPPILLIHGSADTVVRIRNSKSLHAKQKAAGGDITLRALDGASHNDLVLTLGTLFRKRYPVVEEIVRFLDLHSHKQSNPLS